MTNKDKKIEFFQYKLKNKHSALEDVIYSDAILLLYNDVNPDKVQNWVNNVLGNYNNKPKPLSDREKQKNEEKKKRKEEKINLFNLINNKISTLFNEYGILKIGFFDWKEVSDSDFILIEHLVKSKGYFLTSFGDGAVEVIISKIKLDKTFFTVFKELENESNSSEKDTKIDEMREFDFNTFKESVTKI